MNAQVVQWALFPERTQRTCGITGRPAMKFADEWEAITVAAHAQADCIIRGVLVRFVERAA